MIFEKVNILLCQEPHLWCARPPGQKKWRRHHDSQIMFVGKPKLANFVFGADFKPNLSSYYTLIYPTIDSKWERSLEVAVRVRDPSTKPTLLVVKALSATRDKTLPRDTVTLRASSEKSATILAEVLQLLRFNSRMLTDSRELTLLSVLLKVFTPANSSLPARKVSFIFFLKLSFTLCRDSCYI